MFKTLGADLAVLKYPRFAVFLTVSLYTFDKAKQCIGTMTIEIDFLQKKSIDSNPYDTDKMAAEFIQQFNSQAFSVGQQVRPLLILKCP
ncbi:hypothetical protein AV530_006993 [Patagioenas fasciata monilis]|uniref:Vesicle-fusing ATPase n=1 Tax=Patagioenas fasciata monilis TaxID=372326 RepID=A0A1V4JQ39_PATFA|nr:hypothetical protein AV530_006993 [Patagioenas fasciata monilis]